jgi:hypothetical protein
MDKDNMEGMKKAWKRIRDEYRQEIEKKLRIECRITDEEIRKMYRDLCPVDIWPDGVDDGYEWTCTGKERDGLVNDMLMALRHVTGIKESHRRSRSKGTDRHKSDGHADETTTDRAIRNYSEYYELDKHRVTQTMVAETRDGILGWSMLHEAIKHYAEYYHSMTTGWRRFGLTMSSSRHTGSRDGRSTRRREGGRHQEGEETAGTRMMMTQGLGTDGRIEMDVVHHDHLRRERQ